MRMTIEKAKKTGVAFVATTHSNHYGAAAYWAMMALQHGMIGFSATNAPATVAPTGGRTAMLGTNPFAIAIPAGQEQPMVLDLATTVVARGRILLYAKQNKPLEPGWAFDAQGRPTTDAQAALKGLLAPIGGYKGYGIALAIDMLCGVLTGSSYGTHFPGFLADNLKEPTDVGSVFAAVNVESFMDLPDFTAGMVKISKSNRKPTAWRGSSGEMSWSQADRLKNGIRFRAVVRTSRRWERLAVAFPTTALLRPTRESFGKDSFLLWVLNIRHCSSDPAYSRILRE
jgi:LDH2 family malate/lactate/ureidoglycolate dehydrogenase